MYVKILICLLKFVLVLLCLGNEFFLHYVPSSFNTRISCYIIFFYRKPSDYESRGRLSGSREWREERGEVGRLQAGHTFEFSRVGDHAVRYHTATDVYHVLTNGAETARIGKWSNGVHAYHNMFRKVEADWQQTYLARTGYLFFFFLLSKTLKTF